MTGSIALSLIQNTAILLSFILLYDYIWAKEEDSKRWYEKVLAGVCVGCIGLVLMKTPGILQDGLIFDTRTILLTISGLFLGFIPTVVAIVITGINRIIIGGNGVWMGLATILSAGGIGILWGKKRPNWREGNYFLELLSLGFLVHLIMLVCTLLLPKAIILNTFKALLIPVFLIYSPGTMLLGLLMLKRTENWKNKNVLRETKAMYVSLVEHLPAAIFRKTRDGRYDYVNSRYCALKGLTAEEIIGKNPIELAEYEKSKELGGRYKKAPRQRTLANKGIESHDWIIRHGQKLESEEIYEQEDGSLEYFQVVKIPIFNIIGEVVGSQGMQFDITLQKKMQSDLLIAKEKAEESDRLKTSFLHNISHEIRTPMNAIVGFSNILNDNELAADKRALYTEVIIQSSNQLLFFIDDIVRISTIESGQEKINRTEFQVNVLCFMAYNQFVEKAERSGIDFQIKPGFSDLEDWIFSDEAKILDVLTNLLVNAFKFTVKGHIYLGYNLKDNKLEFYVEDTGVGIAEEFKEDIFKRFRQADSTLSRPFGGSGLGLSICKAYVELLGGTIWVDSKIAVGSCFYFTLPYTKSEMFNNNDYLSSLEEDVQGSQEKSFTILVAEDEELNFILLKEILSHLKVKVLRAKNGEEAIGMMTPENNIDLILMDLKMPVMDGYEATKLIKDKFPLVPILALTAYSHDSDKERALECGCSDFISKPFNKIDLIEKMSAQLNHTF